MLCRYCEDPLHAHDLDQRAEGRIVPGSGVSAEQRRLEREAELAARDDYGEPSEGAWVALGLVLLALAGFVALAIMVVKLLRSCAVLPVLALIMASALGCAPHEHVNRTATQASSYLVMSLFSGAGIGWVVGRLFARFQWRISPWGYVMVLAVGTTLAFLGGCARLQPAASPVVTPKPPEVLILSERVGGTVAEIIEAATGQRPYAVAAPGLPIIVFSPKDATDPGLIAHELVHVRQQADMGPLRWSAVYVRDLLECEAGGVGRAVCLKTIPLEAEAYWVQRGVSAGRAP